MTSIALLKQDFRWVGIVGNWKGPWSGKRPLKWLVQQRLLPADPKSSWDYHDAYLTTSNCSRRLFGISAKSWTPPWKFSNLSIINCFSYSSKNFWPTRKKGNCLKIRSFGWLFGSVSVIFFSNCCDLKRDFFFCSASLPLAIARWGWLTLSILSPLF